jgi:hypothetical protein
MSRTTLDIDDDVLQAAKEIAANRGSTAGRVLSDWGREALTPEPAVKRYRNGVPLLPKRRGARKVTSEDVYRLRDEE